MLSSGGKPVRDHDLDAAVVSPPAFRNESDLVGGDNVKLLHCMKKKHVTLCVVAYY